LTEPPLESFFSDLAGQHVVQSRHDVHIVRGHYPFTPGAGFPRVHQGRKRIEPLTSPDGLLENRRFLRRRMPSWFLELFPDRMILAVLAVLSKVIRRWGSSNFRFPFPESGILGRTRPNRSASAIVRFGNSATATVENLFSARLSQLSKGQEKR
jgi:hypothetical protein